MRLLTCRDGLGLRLWHSGHWQATNVTQIGAIWTAFEAPGRYAFPGFGIRLVVLGCFLFALVAVWASKIVVGAHCHDIGSPYFVRTLPRVLLSFLIATAMDAMANCFRQHRPKGYRARRGLQLQKSPASLQPTWGSRVHAFSYQFPYQWLRCGERNQVALSTKPPTLLPLNTKQNPPHIAV